MGFRAAAAILLVVLAAGDASEAAAEDVAAPEGGARVAPSVSDDSQSKPAGKNELGVWGGGSVASSTMIGKSTGFGLALAGVHYGRELWRNDALSFGWTLDAIPLALLSFDRGSDRHTIYGAGIAPLGFCVGFERWSWIRPYVAASGGFLYFDERIPADGEKFNFTYDFGAGVELPVIARYFLTLGYRYHHISNGGLADSNPGFDSNILYAGFSMYP